MLLGPNTRASSSSQVGRNMSTEGAILTSCPGSGGFANDLVFYGGLNGAVFGNQQFTMRNLTFYNAVTAINQIWSWGWTYKSVSINNCSTGIAMNGGGRTAQTVGSVTVLDSSITNTAIGIITAHDLSSSPATAGSLVIENVYLYPSQPLSLQHTPTNRSINCTRSKSATSPPSSTVPAPPSPSQARPAAPPSPPGVKATRTRRRVPTTSWAPSPPPLVRPPS